MTDASDPRPRITQAIAEFDARMRATPPQAWDRPSPCAGWTARDVANHMVYECRWMPHLLHGQELEEVGDRYDGDLLGDDPQASWEQAVAVVAAEAASDPLDRTIHTSFGDISSRFYLWQLTAEFVVHAWDLARAVGGDERLDPGLVEDLTTWFADYEAMYRDELGVTGPRAPVADHADPQTRLLAAFGRQA